MAEKRWWRGGGIVVEAEHMPVFADEAVEVYPAGTAAELERLRRLQRRVAKASERIRMWLERGEEPEETSQEEVERLRRIEARLGDDDLCGLDWRGLEPREAIDAYRRRVREG